MQLLEPDDRLRLLRFACSLAWADLEVQGEEREFVGQLVRKLELSPREAQMCDKWLAKPPEVDPQEVPPEHRELFLSTLRSVVAGDGRVTPEEKESLDLLEELMR